MLTLESIKNINSKPKTWSQRIKLYQSVYKRYRKKKIERKASCTKLYQEKATLTMEVSTSTQEVQTESSRIPPTSKTKATQNQLVATSSSAQQTIASVLFSRKTVTPNQNLSLTKSSKTCQTDLIGFECTGVQCKRITLIKSTNTEENTRNSSTQSDLFIVTSPERSCEPLAWGSSGKDFDVVIYMLNEIGEIVINQNQLLNSSNDMMKQLMQVNLLAKTKSLESATRAMSTQTDLPVNTKKLNSSSQTLTNFTKPRKLSFLKVRSSQHKKII